MEGESRERTRCAKARWHDITWNVHAFVIRPKSWAYIRKHQGTR